MSRPGSLTAAALGLLLFAGLSFGRASAPSRGMDTATRRKLTRAEQARRRRAEDKADYALAAKRCAEIDAGRSKVYTREEALRVLGIRA